jgi:hypothetical protein
MTTPMEIRTRLVQNGFTPIPVAGKAAVLPEWQKRTVTSPDDLEMGQDIPRRQEHRVSVSVCTHLRYRHHPMSPRPTM